MKKSIFKFKRMLSMITLFVKYDLLRQTLYYEYFSRDCDMYQTGGVKRVKGFISYLIERKKFRQTYGFSYMNIIDKSEFYERRNLILLTSKSF